jgi:hypothetical protein
MDSKQETEIEQLKDSYQEWFSAWEWRWFLTMKIDSGRPSRRRAIALFDQWIGELGKAEGSSSFRWIRVLEHGRDGDHLHIHALIGGFRNRKAHWGRRWEKLGGEVVIERYNPDEGGIRYLLKTMNTDGDIDLDYQLPGRVRRTDDGTTTG